ncbi:shikimate kinase [Desulforamulus aquiferis]|uniref:Shikimate kinase n=1 Tax=Desulforamulus aquiferis TaxID=1397668 RepID=A0AAW7ZH09_9FIRM|nr:shikimate kinase [Desulforamulus aquiferis]MDO7788667.1 shikimate kinase [Desulforamulus aquiferis]RYD05347.1 hypothetical protein N752_09900 [Desulforamulus aquiferis]
MKSVILIGFMGSGKSTVGSRLAKRLGYKFIDTDCAIEDVTGLTVERIFSKYGVKRFRGEEALLVTKLAGKDNLVISTGGGLVLSEENVRLLTTNGVFVSLRATADTIMKRVRNKRTRPLLAKGNLRETVTSLLEQRKEAYGIAELTIDVDQLTPEQIVDIIYKYLKEREYI